MSEKLMRKMIVDALRPLHAVSIENGVGVGTPDVNCAAGWIELKECDAWPVRPDTPLRVPCFSPEQKIWLMKRYNAGGTAWLLLKVGADFLLFSGAVAAEHLGISTRAELIELADAAWLDGFDKEGFLEIVGRGPNAG